MEKWVGSKNEGISLFKTFHSNSSVSKLGEFHKKLIASTKSSNSLSIPNWKVFRTQVNCKISPKNLQKPKLDYYSDISSFRTNSPTSQGSPMWRSKVRQGSIISNFSGKISPIARGNSKLMQVLKLEDLKKGVETIYQMNKEDFDSLPSAYLQNICELSEIVRKRIMN